MHLLPAGVHLVPDGHAGVARLLPGRHPRAALVPEGGLVAVQTSVTPGVTLGRGLVPDPGPAPHALLGLLCDDHAVLGGELGAMGRGVGPDPEVVGDPLLYGLLHRDSDNKGQRRNEPHVDVVSSKKISDNLMSR